MKRLHIFCVNGDPTFLSFLQTLLQDEQYNVTTINFVPQTFDQIAALQPSAMVIDLAIDQKAGWDLLQRLQDEAITNQIPVMVVSTDPHLLEEAKANQQQYGADVYITKPFDLNEMLDGLRKMVGDE